MEGINNKKIAFIGYGLENQALLAWFLKHQAPAQYTILDTNKNIKKEIKNVSWRLGADCLKNLDDFDIIYRSPGCPLFLPELQKVKNKITSAMNLFMELCPTTNIIGVTGSKGKGTTASLIYTILKKADRSVYLGGNIGVAPFTFLDKLDSDSYVVLELSSFQLEDLKISPKYSILTNLFPEHLEPADPNNPNYHQSFEIYKQAKLNIAKWPQNKYFLTHERLRPSISGAKVKYFDSCSYPSKLAGEFNKENIAAAVMLAEILKIDKETIKKAIATFKGLPHRLEKVAKKNGITYYDNSFSTTPESTIADIKSFPGAIIMLGGADKGANFKELANEVAKNIKLVILFKGDASPRIKRELLTAGFPANKLTQAGSMAEAVKKASTRGKDGDVVLLSTACASFGLFKNYKERGDLFKKYVKDIK
jgi:UDP-N-acetylmuramoylalanine--D-glutamate ligase